MNRVVVFGAGLVAGAHVHYLLDHGYQVTVASRTESKARALVGDHPNGKAVAFDVEKEGDERLDEIVARHDLAVSLLPYLHHPRVARSCLRTGKHMVTTSYVKEEMLALDEAARKAEIVLLNEIGVDPGIDHMTAMKVIHRVQRQGGRVTRFTSYCGGLPAPEANTNPLGYKFSWSPRGVLMAGKNPARFRRDGEMVEIPGPELFAHYWSVPIEVEGRTITFEAYPNRDSLSYAEVYGIRDARTILRSTLRYEGWCATLRALVQLGLLDEAERQDLEGLTYAQLLARAIGIEETADLRSALAARLGVAPTSFVVSNMAWLGLLSEEPLPAGARSSLDVMTATMLGRMQYEPGERDMLVLQHEFLAEYADRKEKITSTMVDFGTPHGASSMDRTVGLPAAVGARMILEGKIRAAGVQVPVTAEIYEPVLEELEKLGIRFTERTELL